jgi:hypothetical protein
MDFYIILLITDAALAIYMYWRLNRQRFCSHREVGGHDAFYPTGQRGPDGLVLVLQEAEMSIETQPRWKALGLPEEVLPHNPYVFIDHDRRAADDGSTPEHPGPSLASLSPTGTASEKPPRHHCEPAAGMITYPVK